MARPVEYGKLYDLLDDFGKGVVESAVSNIRIMRRINGKSRRTTATGTLEKSLRYDVTRKGKSTTIGFLSVGTGATYADFIEQGVNGTERNRNSPYSFRGNPIPVTPIYKWIKAKGIKPRNVDDPNRMKRSQFTNAAKESKRRGKEITQEDLLRSMAARMAKSISRKGIEGIHYFQDALETELDKRGPEFLETITAIIDEVLEQRKKKR
jgi:hypothetical protein